MRNMLVVAAMIIVGIVSGCATYGTTASINDTPGTRAEQGFPSQVVGP